MTLQLESFFVNRTEYFLHKKDVLIMFGQIQLKKERYGLIPGTQNRSILHLEIVKMGSILGKKKRLTLLKILKNT